MLSRPQAERMARATLCLGCEAGEPTETRIGGDVCHLHRGLWRLCEAARAPKMTARIADLLLQVAGGEPVAYRVVCETFAVRPWRTREEAVEEAEEYDRDGYCTDERCYPHCVEALGVIPTPGEE